MIATCFDCGITKRGCKKIIKITFYAWLKDEKTNPKFMGKPICKKCYNFSKKLENEFGKGHGFYKVA
jgi:hypothetical protein